MEGERGVRDYFSAVRRRFDTTDGPLSESTWNIAIISAKKILGFSDRRLDDIEYSRLVHVAWYLLTFPVADWPETHREPLPFVGHRYPGRAERARFEALVLQQLGLEEVGVVGQPPLAHINPGRQNRDALVQRHDGPGADQWHWTIDRVQLHQPNHALDDERLEEELRKSHSRAWCRCM